MRAAFWRPVWVWWHALRIGIGYRFGRRGNELGPRPDRPPDERAWLARVGDELAQDFQVAVRAVLRQPRFTVVVVATLAIGIGANATMFGVVSRLLLQTPPHLEGADNLVRLQMQVEDAQGRGFSLGTVSYPVYADLVSSDVFEGVAAITRTAVVLGEGAGAQRVRAAQVSGNYFQLLGVVPVLGRALGPGDDAPPSGSDVAVISTALRQRQFANRDPLGAEIRINGQPFTVVGVAPPGFTGESIAPVDLWMPHAASMAGEDPGWPRDRYRLAVQVVARVPEGTDLERVRAAAGKAYVRGQEPFSSPGFRPTGVEFVSLVPGLGGGVGASDTRIALWAAAVALAVLLISIANITNLFLVQALGRRREIAVRTALGMGTGRMLRQLLVESSAMAVLGGALGCVLAVWGGDVVIAVLLPDVARPAAWVPAGIVPAAVGAAALAALVAGMAPALHARAEVRAAALQQGHATASRTAARTRGGLLVVQTALSMVLLFGAGLFVMSLWRVQTQDLGLRLDGVFVAAPTIDDAVGAGERRELFERGVDVIRALPEVERAVSTTTIPFGPRVSLPVSAPDVAEDPFAGRQLPYLNPVAPGHFELLGIEITRGRAFNVGDTVGAEYVAVLSEGMAAAFWPGEDPLGKCIRITTDMSPPNPLFGAAVQASIPCRRVVGIVRDARRSSIRPEDDLIVQYYVPHAQLEVAAPGQSAGPVGHWAWLIRLREGAATAAAGRLQRELQGSLPGLWFVEVRPYAALIEPQVRPWRLGASMFTLFGLLALAMAGLGTYSMLAYAIRQQRREVGIRMALGASAPAVVALVVRRSLLLAAAGTGLGTVGGLVLGGRLAPLLFDTSGTSLPLLALSIAVLGLALLAAGALPSWHATRTDPAMTLREP